jgi:hypothetical protein
MADSAAACARGRGVSHLPTSRPLTPSSLPFGDEALLLRGLVLRATPVRVTGRRAAQAHGNPARRDLGKHPVHPLAAAGRAGRGAPRRDDLLKARPADAAIELVERHLLDRTLPNGQRTRFRVAHSADPARDSAIFDPDHEPELRAERDAALVPLHVEPGDGEHPVAQVGELERSEPTRSSHRDRAATRRRPGGRGRHAPSATTPAAEGRPDRS